MPTLRSFFAAALLGAGLTVGPLYAAEPPSSEAVQASLDKLADSKLPDADKKTLQTVLQNTLNQLNNQRDYEQKLIDLKQQLATAPKQTIENARELTRLKATTVVPVAQRFPANRSPNWSRSSPIAPPSKVTCKKPWPTPTA